MAKQTEFSVSKRNGPSTTCQWDAPEKLDDPRWGEVVSNPEEDINELAVQNLIIKIQSGARNALEDGGPEAAQRYVNEYKYGARTGGGFRAVKVGASDVKKLRFTEEQMAALRAAGVKFESEDAEEPANA